MKDKAKKGLKILKVVYIISVIMLLAVSLILYLYVKDGFNTVRNSESVVSEKSENEEGGQEYELGEDEYAIDVYEKDGNKIINNKEAGISMTVPSDWIPNLAYSTDTNKELKLKVLKTFSEESYWPTDMDDGMIIEIYSYDSNNMSLEDWIIKEEITNCIPAVINDMGSCMRKKDFLESDENDGYVPPYGNWSTISYIFEKGNLVYEAFCYSVGEKYKTYSSECDKLLLTNIIIE